MTRSLRAAVAGSLLVGGAALVTRAGLTLDIGIGRRIRPLGPIVLDIAAPPEVVFDVIAAPYLGRTPRALRNKLEVIERGADLVLAAHFTPVAPGLTVPRSRPCGSSDPTASRSRSSRGRCRTCSNATNCDRATSVPRSSTAASSAPTCGHSAAPGAMWSPSWEQTVEQSLESVRTEAERRARGRSGT
jgi:hypothetical protein